MPLTNNFTCTLLLLVESCTRCVNYNVYVLQNRYMCYNTRIICYHLILFPKRPEFFLSDVTTYHINILKGDSRPFREKMSQAQKISQAQVTGL